MFHTADSESRQFQQLRVAAEREFQQQASRISASAKMAVQSRAVERPMLEPGRVEQKLVRSSKLEPTVVFRKAGK